MKLVVVVASKVVSLLSILFGIFWLLMSIPAITGLLMPNIFPNIWSFIFMKIFLLACILNPVCILTSGILLIQKYTSKVYLFTGISLGTIAFMFVSPLIGPGEADKGFYAQTLFTLLPIIIIDMFMLIICYSLKAIKGKETLLINQTLGPG